MRSRPTTIDDVKIRDESESESAELSSIMSTSTPAWHNAAAGGAAGLGSRMLTAPLDLIRIRRQLAVNSEAQYPTESMLQTWRNIFANEGGVTALFRGNLAAVYLWMGYSAVQFSLYSSTKERLQAVIREVNHNDNNVTMSPNQASSLVAFVAGATAGACATLATYPFDVCRTAFAARGKQVIVAESSVAVKSYSHIPFSSLVDPCYRRQGLLPQQTLSAAAVQQPPPPTSLVQFARQVYQQRGYRGFYAGVGPAIVQIIPYMGLNFTIYEFLTKRQQSSTSNSNGQGSVIMTSAYAGSMSGAISKILVYPLDTVKRRLQGQALSVIMVRGSSTRPLQHRPTHYRNMVHCIVTMYRQEGCLAFYKGIVPAVYKSTVGTALSFALFQWTKRALQRVGE